MDDSSTSDDDDLEITKVVKKDLGVGKIAEGRCKLQALLH